MRVHLQLTESFIAVSSYVCNRGRKTVGWKEGITERVKERERDRKRMEERDREILRETETLNALSPLL